jgi:hypothetical protein
MLLLCPILILYDMTNTVSFDLTKYEELKKEYVQAVQNRKNSFWFEGTEYLTSYCKYLLEYLKLNFEN